MNATSLYYVIIGIPSFNALEATFSTLYLTMKYPLDDGHVRVIKGDQGLVHKCYKDSLKFKNKSPMEWPREVDPLKDNLVILNPWEDLSPDSLTPMKDLKRLQIGSIKYHTTHIDSNLTQQEKEDINQMLRDNFYLFAWKSSDIPGIDPDIRFHKLPIDPMLKEVVLRKRKDGEEKGNVFIFKKEYQKMAHVRGFH